VATGIAPTLLLETDPEMIATMIDILDRQNSG